MSIIYLIIVGAIAGWLASLIMKGRGSGLIMNIIIGILGAIIGNWATDYFNIHLASGTAGLILDATLGAVILLFIVSLFR